MKPPYKITAIIENKRVIGSKKDILEVGTINKMNAHFIGSIVYGHDDDYTSLRIKELTVIDGQHRKTTLTLFYLALYRITEENRDIWKNSNANYLILS